MKSKIFVIILGISVFIGILAFARYSINQSVNTQEATSLIASTSNKPYAKKSNRIDGQYPVQEVVDGDTIKVLINKKITTIRILGIDTPETFVTRTGYRECYGQEASDFAKKELTGKTVTIETDSSQDQKDKYGRVLAHVFYSGSLYYEEESIRNGFGFRYVYKKPTRYDDRLQQAEATAKTNISGVWKYCGGKRNHPPYC